MRTTLTLDDDVAALLERLRQERQLPFKTVVNEALREGLRQLRAPACARAPFVTRSVDLGRCRFADVDNIADVLAVAEGDSFA